MAKSKIALYAAGVTCLGFICFALASAAIGIPIWGYYDTPSGGYDFDHGYFGPFKVCKQLAYNREKCGNDVSKFRLSSAIFISGVMAVLSSTALGLFCLLSVIQIAMISSREKVVMSYTSLVMTKLILALLGGILSLVATVLFALQIDESEKYGFRVSRGVSFYLQSYNAGIHAHMGLIVILILFWHLGYAKDNEYTYYGVITMFYLILFLALLLHYTSCLSEAQYKNFITDINASCNTALMLIVVIILSIGLFVLALYDVLYSKRPGGDPTMMIDASSPSSATTINNPGFKEPRTKNGISVTDASGKPYAGIRNGSGSVASMSTMVTSVSNGSTVESVTRSPLRSSLKKPRPKPDPALGIQNPGYSGSGSSPPMRRNGSVKKVRIQTHSTEV